MVFKHFRIICTVRVILLGATICLFFYLVFRTSLYATLLIVGGLILYQIYSLIRYVEKTNRDLTRFLESIQHADFSQTFSGNGLGSSFDKLKQAFNRVVDEFRRIRTEKEEHFRYLQTVVQHVGIGLVAFQENGNIELINTAAKRLLRVPRLRNLRDLESLSKPLVETLFQLKSGGKELVKVQNKDELLQIAVYATEFRIRQQTVTLVSIQNIRSELEEKEMEAWQNLIRVLTHEIMNSVTPIASLASTVNEFLAKEDGSAAPQSVTQVKTEAREDMRGAIETIQKRSEGLLHFVDAYRNLTRIPKPTLQIFPISELFERVKHLMQAQIADNSIRYSDNTEPERLELTGDPELIEQVLINLLMNSIQAVRGQRDAIIELSARIDERSRVVIQVKDNGPGLLEEALDKVFIPFFTTKEGGTGIGLSLSRQIMRSHRGTITVHSRPHDETVFSLRF
ncbi:MAG: ATP-binding protein [bacterium]